MTKWIKEKWNDFKELENKEKLFLILPYAACIFVCSRVAELYRLCSGNFIMMAKNLEYLYKSFPPRFQGNDILYGASAGILLVSYLKWELKRNKKNTRKGVEYGSARWGTAKDIKPFIDPIPENNIILSKTERLTMAPKMKLFELNRNKNIIVYGSSGSGKTFSFVKPNIMQCFCSYVVTDPNGYNIHG